MSALDVIVKLLVKLLVYDCVVNLSYSANFSVYLNGCVNVTVDRIVLLKKYHAEPSINKRFKKVK
jgi:hypothetical protein